MKIAYWIATAIMLAVFAFSAGMYITKFEMVQGFFSALDFPTWVVAPLAALKILGIIAIATNRSAFLTEWAYAGFFFDALLATGAHYFAGHGLLGLSMLALVATLVSRALFSARTEDELLETALE